MPHAYRILPPTASPFSTKGVSFYKLPPHSVSERNSPPHSGDSAAERVSGPQCASPSALRPARKCLHSSKTSPFPPFLNNSACTRSNLLIGLPSAPFQTNRTWAGSCVTTRNTTPSERDPLLPNLPGVGDTCQNQAKKDPIREYADHPVSPAQHAHILIHETCLFHGIISANHTL